MEQTTIQFRVSKRKTINVHTAIVCKYRQFNQWLDKKSIFYSRIAEFSVTRRMVLRVNAVTLCLLLGAFSIEQYPILSTLAAICAGCLVHKFNKTKKEANNE